MSTCADKVAYGIVSMSVIPGAFACFDAGFQKALTDAGVNSDEAMARHAQLFPPITIQPCKIGVEDYSTTESVKTYLWVQKSGSAVLVVKFNKSDGLVNDINILSKICEV